MSVAIRVYLADNTDIDLLGRWLGDVPDVSTEPVPSPSGPAEQGDAWEFLSVLCGSGGAAAVALRALAIWIESKVTHARVKIGDVEVVLRGPDAEALARLVEASGKAVQGGS
ncbi:effector-associated constant component EACC1 [Actinocrispum wychmicini]|uniref:Uncharacterized protein n=1 Tax=Actinocrispum wychmicini TaxID=1213861 RepID=A0A4R2JUP7_9PSEU|nr:hypothetical protein [Actinocrispum wychmicini]TCO60759.1 hypothetical protein EV192_103334 [Actinocrispum wychmicini]